MAARLRILLTGATGYLGRHVAEQAAGTASTFDLVGAARAGADVRLDLADPGSIAPAVAAARPDVVLHAGAMSSIAACEADPGRALLVNAEATAALCACARRVVYVSTDLVFGGDRAPYAPLDRVQPRSMYGRSKARGEEPVLAAVRGVVVRLPLLFGRSFDGKRGATDMIRSAAAAGRAVTLFTDEFRTPLHVGDAAGVLLELGRALAEGRVLPRIVHAAGPERLSRWELGERFVQAVGLAGVELRGARCEDPLRPKDVALQADCLGRPLAVALAES